MSAERLSFRFNSLIPETYKSKAEAFAKCLQHKLLSLGKYETPDGEPIRRLNSGSQLDCDGGGTFFHLEEGPYEGRSGVNSVENFHKKTDESDEEFCSHSESENGEGERAKKKLTTMSSEESTMDSWSSCQENWADCEKFDSENEESNSLAAQIKGSPKLRSFNIRAKRKELREKTWKRNSKKNHSSSSENIESEGMKQTQNRNTENFDREFNSQYILLDGLEPEDDDVPHRILRESSSTSNLERHFSFRDNTEALKNSFKSEKKVSEESSVTDLCTPPPSPDLEKVVSLGRNNDVVATRLQFAEIQTDSGEPDFVEVNSLKDFNVDEMCRSVKKIGGVVVECPSDSITDLEVPTESPEEYVITCVEVLQDTPEESSAEENLPVIVDTPPSDNSQDGEDIERTEDDEIMNSRTNMRRCSSLKTWKTPPGTPGSKKIVRFADALGLDLADVRTFLDEIPKVPSSAYQDLHFDCPKFDQPPSPPPTPILVPLFQQPGIQMDFFDKVQNQKICLESTVVTVEGFLTVTGFVRVQNLGFHKSVHVRYTLNNWNSFSDLQATYVPNSCDGFSDRFSFSLYGHTLKIGEKLEFALRLECSGAQYWDNNGGLNYVFNCLPQSSAVSFFSPFGSNQVDPWFDFY